MMGHIYNILLEMVKTHHGDKGIDRLFKLADLPKDEFLSEKIYPEEHWKAIYSAMKELYGVDDDAAQKTFSDYFMEVSPKKFPAIFEEAGSAKGLLEKVPLIHKQWPSAASSKDFKEKLSILECEKNRLVYKYDSPNRLCGVLRYAVEGVLTHYGESGEVKETQCARTGAPWCEIEIHFLPSKS